MPQAPLTPIETGLTAEERAILVAALSAFEVGKRYAAELESKSTIGGRNRRVDLFREANIAGRLCDRLLIDGDNPSQWASPI